VSTSTAAASLDADARAIQASIVQAQDIDAVVGAARPIQDLPGRLLTEHAGADSITAQLTLLNDLIVQRLLELTGTLAALREANGCWVALGSQGRQEQTLATDQDNAILFDDQADPGMRRQLLLPLALQVNRALDRCGFALCRGNVMASNPAWCLSLSEWQRCFASWIDRPEPQALLNAAIFFDFRPIGGPHALIDRLRSWLDAYARDNGRFLVLMVFNALRNQPPLGLLRDFAVSRGGDHPHTLDLKIGGVQPFVEAARILALSEGIAATRTVERLAEAGRARSIPEPETGAWCQAFDSIQTLRLQLNTAQLAQGAAIHNAIDPYALDASDRKTLKDALRQARNLQGRLAREFSLAGTIRP
jgi:CBS domain-containing protein